MPAPPSNEILQSFIIEKAFQIGTTLKDANQDVVASTSIPFLDSSSNLQVDGTNLAWDDTNNIATILSINMAERTEPGNTAAGTATLYAVDVSGSTAVHIRFPAGQAQQIAIEQ